MKDDFVIPLYVEAEKDLYSEYDPSGLSLNSALMDYLSDCVEDRHFGADVLLVLRSPEKPDMDRFRKAEESYFERLISRNIKESRIYRTDSIRLLVLGIVFIAIGLFLNGRVNPVIGTIVSTIGSFSVWEASAVWIKTLPVLRGRRMVLKKLSTAEIRYEKAVKDGAEKPGVIEEAARAGA